MPLGSPSSLQRLEAGIYARANRGYSADIRKSRLARECVVGPRGLPFYRTFNGLDCPTGLKRMIERKREFSKLSNRNREEKGADARTSLSAACGCGGARFGPLRSSVRGNTTAHSLSRAVKATMPPTTKCASASNIPGSRSATHSMCGLN